MVFSLRVVLFDEGKINLQKKTRNTFLFSLLILQKHILTKFFSVFSALKLKTIFLQCSATVAV